MFIKYRVNIIETEFWKRSYLIDAPDEQEAKRRVYEGDYYWIEEVSDDYDSTIDREIIEIKPINTNEN